MIWKKFVKGWKDLQPNERTLKLVGWNGVQEKRFRYAFWFKLTELILTRAFK